MAVKLTCLLLFLLVILVPILVTLFQKSRNIIGTSAVSGGALGATTMALCAILGRFLIGSLLFETALAGSITLIADVSPQKSFYNPASLEVVKEYTLEGSIFTLSPNGTYVAVSSQTDVKIFETTSGKEVAEFTGFNTGVHDGSFNKDEELIAVCCGNGQTAMEAVKVFNIKQKKQIASFTMPATAACSVAFSNDNKYIATPEINTGIIFIWNLAEKKLDSQIPTDFNTSCSISFDPSGKNLIASSIDQALRVFALSVFSIESKSKVKDLLNNTDYIPRVDFTNDGKQMLTADPAGKILIFDTNKWEEVASHQSGNNIRWSCYDESCRFAAFVFNSDGEVQVLNLNSKDIVKKVKIEPSTNPNPYARIAFTRRNSNFVIAQITGKVIVLGRKD